MRKAKVVFDYDPQEDDELVLKVGDIVTEVKDADVGWCEGLLNGKRGMFPDNFVEMIAEEEKKVPPPPAANKKPSKKKNVRRIKINFPYAAENADEISLEVGDIIEITKDVEEGWAEGINRGKKGVFPTNFGEMIDDSPSGSVEDHVDATPDKKEEEIENKPEEFATSSQKKVKGIGFGNIFGEGPIKLRQRSIGEADKKKNLSTPPSKPTAAPAKEKTSTTPAKEPAKEITPAKSKKALKYCRVMFDYAKDNDDEMELKKGEIIVILSKNPGDEGWWEGQKEENGKRMKGVFPDNFVSELTPEETKEYERHHQQKADESAKESKAAKSQNKEVKKVTPLMPTLPPQAAKPVVNNTDAATTNDSAEHFTEPTTTEHTLAHMKRPAGPKNRRKPGAAERREKAAAVETPEVANGADEESEEDAKPEKAPEPAPKREPTKRGVAVLPGLGGGGGEGATGETPSWLQNLKSRQSVKKPVPQPQAEESGAAKPPAWLANLKKRQSSEFPEKTAAPTPKEKVALQPKPSVDKAKPAPDKAKPVPEKPANGQAGVVPPAKPAAPKPAQKPMSPTEKPLAAWQIERQQKARRSKTADSQEDRAPEPPTEQPAVAAATTEHPPQPSWKNSLPRKTPAAAVKSPTESHPPTQPPVAAVKKTDRPPIGAPITAPIGAPRAKPPPPKGKPSPAVKPASSTAVEELKTEVKHMKEEMEKIREEMKKDILRLNSELENERNHRISLQEEIRKLRQHVSP